MKRSLEDIRVNLDFVGCDNATALELCAEIERLRVALDQIAHVNVVICKALRECQTALCPEFLTCSDNLKDGQRCACGFEDGPYANAVPKNRAALSNEPNADGRKG